MLQKSKRLKNREMMYWLIGRALVKVYYSGFGKSLVRAIEQGAPAAIPDIRKGLDYLVKKVRSN